MQKPTYTFTNIHSAAKFASNGDFSVRVHGGTLSSKLRHKGLKTTPQGINTAQHTTHREWRTLFLEVTISERCRNYILHCRKLHFEVYEYAYIYFSIYYPRFFGQSDPPVQCILFRATRKTVGKTTRGTGIFNKNVVPGTSDTNHRRSDISARDIASATLTPNLNQPAGPSLLVAPDGYIV